MISNPVTVTGGEYKYRISKMHLKLRDQQLKTIMYIQTAIPKSHGNHKAKIYIIDTHTHTHTFFIYIYIYSAFMED